VIGSGKPPRGIVVDVTGNENMNRRGQNHVYRKKMRRTHLSRSPFQSCIWPLGGVGKVDHQKTLSDTKYSYS